LEQKKLSWRRRGFVARGRLRLRFDGLLEVLQALPDSFPELGQARRSEDDENDQEDDEKFRDSKAAHSDSPGFLA
jgi:hypothetical protein